MQQMPPNSGMNGTGTGWQQNNFFPGQNQVAPPSQPLPNPGFAPQTGGSGQYSSSPAYPQQSILPPIQRNGPPISTIPGQTQRGWAQQPGYVKPQNIKETRKKKKVVEYDDNDDNSKRPSLGVVIVIIILLAILIGGGFFAANQILGNHGTTSSSTPNLVATPGTKPLFSETFQNNSAAWTVTPPTGGKITLSGGSLILESDNHKLLPEVVPSKTFDDFRLDLDGALTSGDAANGYGVYIRAATANNGSPSLYYRFELYGNGAYVIYKGTQDASGTLQSSALKSDSNSVISQSQSNHITILAKGSQITFKVNNTTLYTLTDSSYKSGSIILFVSNVTTAAAGAQATFKNLSVFANP
jgi:hypothetical protein